MKSYRKPAILFVCMGNICRSPTVEALARVEFARGGLDVLVASAGTEDYHVGQPADRRAIAFAEAHGYPLSAHRARQVRADDFEAFDLVLAMDNRNLHDLRRFRPPRGATEPTLFLGDAEVPDPYYGGDPDFLRVIELARVGVAALSARLRAEQPEA
jgi:protein-tyrosine phosphatase